MEAAARRGPALEEWLLALLILTMVTYPVPQLRYALGETAVPLGALLIPVIAVAAVVTARSRPDGFSLGVPLGTALFLYGVSVPLSMLASGRADGPAALRLLVFMGLPPLFWYGARDRPALERLVKLLVLTGLLLTLYGFYGYLTGRVGEETGQAWWENYARYFGIHYLPSTRNSDVHFLAVPLVALLAFVLFGGGRRFARLLALPALLLFLAGIALSFSRGGWIATALALAALGGLWIARHRGKAFPVVASALFLLVLLFTVSRTLEHFRMEGYFMGKLVSIGSAAGASAYLAEEVSNAERLRILGATGEIILRNPLGVGPGNLPGHYRAFGIGTNHPENQYLSVLAETGFPGFFGFMLFLGYPLARYRARVASGSFDWLDAGLLGVSLYLCLAFLFNVEVHNFFIWVVHSLAWAGTRAPSGAAP